MPVTRSQSSARTKEFTISQSKGSQQARQGEPTPTTPPLSQDEQIEAHAIFTMLEPSEAQGIPDDFRKLHIDLLRVLKQFTLRDQHLFQALRTAVPPAYVRLNLDREDAQKTFTQYEERVGDLQGESGESRFLQLFERRIEDFIGRFEKLRAQSPDNFTLARLIVCALVWMLDKVVEFQAGSEAQYDMRESLKKRLAGEINGFTNDAIVPHVEEMEEIIEKLAEGEHQDSPGASTRTMLQNKVTNVKNAMGRGR